MDLFGFAGNIAMLAETTEAATDGFAKEIEEGREAILENPSVIGKFLGDIGSRIVAALPTIIFAIIVLVLGLLLTKLILSLMNRGMKRSKMDGTVKSFLSSCIKIVLYVLVLTAALTALGVPTTSLIAVIGTAGLAIGLALKDSLSNVAGGFIILFSKPFKIGDYIEVNKVEGFVKNINILYTHVVTRDNRAVFIPNSQASGAIVTNETMNELRRIDIVFGISYADDFAKAKRVIIEELKKCERIMDEPEPTVRMISHADSSIQIIVRPYCKSKDYWEAYYDVVEAVRRSFLANDITIPFNQLEVKLIH